MNRLWGFLLLSAALTSSAFAADAVSDGRLSTSKSKPGITALPTTNKNVIGVRKPSRGQETTTESTAPTNVPATQAAPGEETISTHTAPAQQDAFALQMNNMRMVDGAGNTCSQVWSVDVHNSGTGPTTQEVRIVSSSVSSQIDNSTGAPREVQASDSVLPVLQPGETRTISSVVYPLGAYETGTIVRLKKGNAVLGSQTASYPVEGDYSVALGAPTFSSDQFSVAVQNTGTKPIRYASVSFRGITDVTTMASTYIDVKSLSCLPAGESRTFSVAVPAYPVVGYRVFVQKVAPQISTVADRNYLQ